MNEEPVTATNPARIAAEDGFTIIEVIVTAIVVAIVMGATFGALSAAGRAGSEQRHRAEAYAIAQKDQARLRSLQISQLNKLDQTQTVTSGGSDYTVRSQGQFVNDTTSDASCDEGSNTSDYIVITSTVTWPSIGTRPATVIKSIVAPPAGSLAPDKGALAVVVRDGAGNGVSGFPVTGTGAGTFSGTTGSTGCVLFTDLPEGNYTLNSSATGRVDVDGNPPSATPTSVVAQSTNTLVLRYDTPGSIRVSFTTRIGGTGSPQPTTGDTVTAFNTGMTQEKAFGTVGTRGSTVTATPLFPFTSPYAVYAGSCATNNPNPNGLTNPPAAAAIANATVTPGGTTNATIQLPALDLTLWSGSSSASKGSTVNNGTVKVTDTQCSVGGTPVKRTFTTNGTGKIPTPGLPYGVYDICASNGTRRNFLTGVPVQTTATDTVREIYLGANAPGIQTGTCP